MVRQSSDSECADTLLPHLDTRAASTSVLLPEGFHVRRSVSEVSVSDSELCIVSRLCKDATAESVTVTSQRVRASEQTRTTAAVSEHGTECIFGVRSDEDKSTDS